MHGAVVEVGRWRKHRYSKMADSSAKPRRTRGTVVYYSRRYFGLGVLAVGVVSGVVYHFSRASQPLRQLIHERLFAPTEEELDRKALMSLVPKKRGETLEKLIEQSKDPVSY